MSKPKFTKQERAARERGLVEAIFLGVTAIIEATAKEWALRAAELRKGLSTTAIKRAERAAHKRADDKPPGFVKAMEAMATFDELAEKYGIPKRDSDTMWGAISLFCMFQLASRGGTFFEAARFFGLLGAAPPRDPATPGEIQIEVVRVRDPNCNCPNCRPRKGEELN